MVNEALQKVFGWSIGHLLNEGYQVKCAGTTDADGNVTDRHLICTLDDHLPQAQAHAVGNPEFVDSMWIVDSTQAGIDWSNPICQICSKPIAP